MSVDLEKLPESKINVAFEFNGGTLNVVIDANKITQDVANSSDYALALAKIVDSWDAKGGGPKPTYDYLRRLPIPSLLLPLFMKCVSEAFPKAQTAGQ